MATVYSQLWASSASPPMRVAGGGGATGAYPYNTAADECDVVSARLTHWSAGPGDFQTVVWAERLFGPETGGYLDGSRMRVTVPYHVEAQAMTDLEGGNAVLLNIVPKGSASFAIRVSALEVGSPGTDTWKLKLEYSEWTGDVTVQTYTFSRAAVEDTDQTLVVCWQDATIDYDGNTADTDGSLKVIFGGVEAYNLTGLRLYVGGTAAAGDVHLVKGYTLGSGLIGTVGAITFDDGGCPSVSSRNLLTGFEHTVDGSDNLIAGAGGSVTGDYNAYFALCSAPPALVADRTFKVCADAIELSAASISIGSPILTTGAQIAAATVTLTDAQIKALPTTPITLVAAPGAGKRVQIVQANLFKNFAAGAYTNLDAGTPYLVLTLGSDEVSTYIGNDSGVSLSALTSFMAANDKHTVLFPYAEHFAGWGLVAPVVAQDTNQALTIAADNGGSGNFTGGNAANTLVVRVLYQILG